jgi:hypothetical protein
MNRIASLLIFYTILVPNQLVHSQNKLDFSGHLQSLNTIWIQELESEWYSNATIYNRLNLKWYLHQNWTLSTSARNVTSYGQFVYINYPYYSDLLEQDEGFVDLTGTIASDSSYIFYTNLDRLNLKFSRGKLEAVAGRQRINWGINMVWNPNDIFNTFNYYDFDYVERPGCDAFRIVYFPNVSSSADVAIKIDKDQKVTLAGMYKFNRWNYDFQVMGGIMTSDIVIGAGWSGNLKKAGFTGEASWFRDKNNFADTSSIFVLSIGINYTLRNSLYLHSSFLYNSNGTTGNAGVDNPLISLREVSPKSFTSARYSVFGQISYPFTPLITGDLSGILNPSDLSMYLGPNINFSLSDNITFLLMSQIFIGNSGTEFGEIGSLVYLRLKWSF